MIASSLHDSTVECGVFGPIGASLTKARLRHLATVLWFSPYRAASSLSGAFDRTAMEAARRMHAVALVLIGATVLLMHNDPRRPIFYTFAALLGCRDRRT